MSRFGQRLGHELMGSILANEREQLEQAIAALEAQRAALGDGVLDPMIAAAREKLAALDRAATPQPTLKGERKLITVMFADVSGFTARPRERL